MSLGLYAADGSRARSQVQFVLYRLRRSGWRAGSRAVALRDVGAQGPAGTSRPRWGEVLAACLSASSLPSSADPGASGGVGASRRSSWSPPALMVTGPRRRCSFTAGRRQRRPGYPAPSPRGWRREQPSGARRRRRLVLPLDRAGGFEEMSRATRLTLRDLVDDPARDPLEQVVGKARPVGGHRVVGGDGADHDRVGVGALVALDADRAHHRAARRTTARARGRGRRRGSPPGGSRRPRAGSRAAPSTSPPTIRIARPGPGNGWRQTKRSGRPSSAPTARTSSLKSIRSGSISSKSRSSGRPPTLWCDLIVAAPVPPPDSITSE